MSTIPDYRSVHPDRIESDTAPCQVTLPDGATLEIVDGQLRIGEHPGFGVAYLGDVDDVIGGLIELRDMRTGVR